MRGRAFGAATLVPPVCIAAVAVAVVIAVVAGGGDPDGHLPVAEPVLAGLLAAAALSGAATTRVALRHVRHNGALARYARRRWRLALGFYGLFSTPVYWWRHMRARPPA